MQHQYRQRGTMLPAGADTIYYVPLGLPLASSHIISCFKISQLIKKTIYMFKHLSFFVNIVWRLVKFVLIYPTVDLFRHNLIL